MIDEGIELDGGVDGVYGNDTMAAVAEYQQLEDGLQVTGAVDAATARALGVNEASEESAEAEQPASTAAAPGTVPAGAGADVSSGAETADPAPGGTDLRWVLVAVAAAVLALCAAVIGRRRVVVRRRARRWARVHPATSPHRSVADLRRSGELPAREPAVRTSDRSHGSDRSDRRDRVETADH